MQNNGKTIPLKNCAIRLSMKGSGQRQTPTPMPTEFLLIGVADEWVLMIADGVNDRCTYEKMSLGVK